MLLSIEEEECHVADSCVEWVIDSATSYLATSNKKFFTTYNAVDFGKVKMGNTSIANTVGIGDVCTQTHIGWTLTLKDVRHLPNLHLNLIFVHALDLDRYCNSFGDGK